MEKTEKFYIIENQHRPDGIINNIVESRSTMASALSFYYDRLSKMISTNLFTKVAVMLADENLNVIEHKVIATQYVAPTEEVTEE